MDDGSNSRGKDANAPVESGKQSPQTTSCILGFDRSTVICSMMACVIVLVLINDYSKWCVEDPMLVTQIGDFDKFQREGVYRDSKMFNAWCGMSAADKSFVRDMVADSVLEWKASKPAWQKRVNGLFKQLVVATAVGAIVFATSPSKLVKQNTVNYFVSSLL